MAAERERGRDLMLRTRYMILRKTPFQESGLIVAGISPDYGRLDFLWKGGRRIGAKKFPEAGLFREFAIEFRDPGNRSGGLLGMSSCEMIVLHDRIAGDLENYLAVCEQASFLLRHSRPMLEMPLVYGAFRNMLFHLEGVEGSSRYFWQMLVKLVFLHEGGLIPEERVDDSGEGVCSSLDSRRSAVLRRLIAFAVGGSGGEIKGISSEYLRRLSTWVDALCSYHSLK